MDQRGPPAQSARNCLTVERHGAGIASGAFASTAYSRRSGNASSPPSPASSGSHELSACPEDRAAPSPAGSPIEISASPYRGIRSPNQARALWIGWP